MKTRACAAILAFLAAPAAADSTTCYINGQFVTCSTPPKSSTQPIDQNAAIEAGRRMVEPDEDTDAKVEQNRRHNRLERVGKMVANGQCGLARDTALREGDFDLAAAVKKACE